MIHVSTFVRPAFQPRHNTTNTTNTIDYERIKLDQDLHRDVALLLQDIAELIKKSKEIKVCTPAQLPDAGIAIEKEAADEEVQDDFYTLNSHRFD